jgi:hypothetical protein
MVRMHDLHLDESISQGQQCSLVFDVAKEAQKLQSLNYACHSQDVHFRWSDIHPSSPEADGGGCPSPAVFGALLLEDPPESGQIEAISVGNAGQVDVGGADRRLESSNPEESRCVSWSAHSLYSRSFCANGVSLRSESNSIQQHYSL